MFKGRKLVIATKHSKESVIAPILEKELGVSCFVPENFDTDVLGTFTGEIERTEDPIKTVRKKCLLAMEQSNCDLGIASEGSFGAHPSIYFASANDEFLLFIDKKNNLEILAREISTDTNFNGKEIQNEKELLEFASQAKFPSHALIIRASKDDTTHLEKGIQEVSFLTETFQKIIDKHSSAFIETDMRAMYNPSRMAVIEKATQKLIDKINTFCPECNTPGFSVTDAKSGLPCNLCGLPTSAIISHIYTCQKCHFSKEVQFPNRKTTEDPTYCDYCNP